GDTIIAAKDDQTVQPQKELLWKLANELFDVFSPTDPKIHELFIEAKEMTNIGFYNMLTCYDKGIAWLEPILHQDVQPLHNNQVQSSQSNQVENEEDILNYDSLPEDIAIEILRKFQGYSQNWDMQRMRTYWKNNRNNK
ncbi:2363_t:CDS:2, partial [Dentiscutata heterogama]